MTAYIDMTDFELHDDDVAQFLFDPELFGSNHMVPIYFHVDHDNRRNYYTVAKLAEEFQTLSEAKAFAKMYFSLVNQGDQHD